MTTEINRKPEEEPRSNRIRPWEPWLQPARPLPPKSILERIPRLWATGKLYWMDDTDGQVKPFPKPEIEEKS